MFFHTNSRWSPWMVIHSDDKVRLLCRERYRRGLVSTEPLLGMKCLVLQWTMRPDGSNINSPDKTSLIAED